MASENAVNITFAALRDRAFDARDISAKRYDSDESSADFKFIEAIALIQIAQELNEIKHILAGREAGECLMETTLDERRASAPEKIDQATLPAGSSMTYYCKSCGHVTKVNPEDWCRDEDIPPRYCKWCVDHGYAKD